MGLQRVKHDLATQQQPTNIYLVPAMIDIQFGSAGGCAKVERTGPFP